MFPVSLDSVRPPLYDAGALIHVYLVEAPMAKCGSGCGAAKKAAAPKKKAK
jgi:hypothetical protein